ncbi:LytTr DNA-binding domain-containing protein [bacterium A37T11]|nr:LytTr DNA-binding domain-containing protein [bacterium A37T11]
METILRQGTLPPSQLRYLPLWLRLLLSIFIGHQVMVIKEADDLITHFRSPSYWLALVLSCLVTFIVLEFNHWMTRRLDRKWPWVTDLRERLKKQLIFCYFLPLLLPSIVFWFIYSVLGVSERILAYLSNEFKIGALFLFSLNVLYILIYSLSQAFTYLKVIHKLAEWATKFKRSTERPHQLRMRNGYKEMTIWVCDIAYFSFKDEGHTVVMRDGRSYLNPYPVEELSKYMNPDWFHKVSRQYIVCISSIASWSNKPNRSLELKLLDKLNLTIHVGRENAAAVIAWATPRIV